MGLDYSTAIELIKKAYEKVTDDKLFIRWITHYEHVNYNDFKSQLLSVQKADNKTEAEVLADVKSIIDTFNKGVS